MAVILSVNAGSSSVKYSLIVNEREEATALFEKKGRGYQFTLTFYNEKLLKNISPQKRRTSATVRKRIRKSTFDQSYKSILRNLVKYGLIHEASDIDRVGYRVVHGGTAFKKPTVISGSVLKKLEKLSDLAPLHNPPQIRLIKLLQKELPKAKHVAIFDTAFHANLPEKAYMYAIPRVFEKKYGIRRYGFHGISYQSCIRQLRTNYRSLPEKIIICHLGSGCSISAVLAGASVDTSMGYTPLEGLPMMTRGGDIDDGAVMELLKLTKKAHLEEAISEVEHILNKKSGMLALSGSQDMRDIIKRAMAKPKSAHALALNYFIYHVVKYIGAYTAALKGCDALVFTGGIGANSSLIRSKIVEHLVPFGFKLNTVKNIENNVGEKISDGDVDIWILDPMEQMEIARQTREVK